MKPNKDIYDIVIIGGGWAGLSAAIKLVDHNKRICIVESAKQLGGRARQVQYRQYSVDNGTHIMVGAYTETLKLLQKVHPQYKENNLLERQPLNLNYKQKNAHVVSIPKIVLPAPLNIIFSFLLASGLSFKEKMLILRFGLRIKLNLIKIKEDISLETFLLSNQQNSRIIKTIWEPLCLAITNTAVAKTSTEIFLQVIKEAFFKARHSSDLLFFKRDLSTTFPTPAQAYIEKNKGKIALNQPVMSIEKKTEYYLVHSRSISIRAHKIILATAPIATEKLLATLQKNTQRDELLNKLKQFTYQPICTVYLQYPKTIQCERTMQGFLGTTVQWMFDKTLTNHVGFISIIISSEGKHMELDNPSLIKEVTTELAHFYPEWPAPIEAFVIREKRATFTASVNINRIRPSNKTALENIFIAGDYTNTLYPATLEGAVRSGLTCAEEILSEQ